MVKKLPASAGRKKLESLSITIPTLPTSAAGSLPKQTELIELRYRVSKGIHQHSELERKEKLSTEIWIRQQEKAGLDVLVDGEMNRGDMIQHFAKKIAGFEEGGTVRVYGNRYYRRPIVKSKVEWKEPIILDMWRYAQRMTHKPLKAVLTGPYTLMDWSFNEHYSSREALCRDLTAVIRKEITSLVDAGARIVQLDEPAITSNPTEFPLLLNAIQEITRDLKAYVILRHGYGNIEPLWKLMQKLPVDNFHLELANSGLHALGILKKTPCTKDLTLGVIDSHSRTIETPRELTDAIKKIVAVVPVNRLWLSTDAGLKTRTIDEGIAKIKALAQAASKFRP